MSPEQTRWPETRAHNLGAWPVVELGELIPPHQPNYGIVKPGPEPGSGEGVPYICPEDIVEGRVKVDKLRRTSSKISAEYQRTILAPGDVIISVRATLDRVAVVDHLMAEANLSRGVARLSPSKRVDSTYLAWSIRSQATQKWILLTARGLALQGLNLGDLKHLPVPLPPLPEQRAIAAALSDADALIAALDALIAKKRAMKQGAMQQLLTGKTRLPGFDGEWEKWDLGDFTDAVAGGTPSTEIAAYWGGDIPWMSSGELNKKFVNDADGRITELGLANSNARMVPKGCVLIGLAGQGKTRGTVALNRVPLTTNQSIAAILPSTGHVSEYLYYNLDNRYEELRIVSAGDGGRGGLNLRLLRQLSVPLPAVEEQRAIAGVLLDMDAEMAAIEARREKVKMLKQGMMQALLAGRVRLVSDREATA